MTLFLSTILKHLHLVSFYNTYWTISNEKLQLIVRVTVQAHLPDSHLLHGLRNIYLLYFEGITAKEKWKIQGQKQNSKCIKVFENLIEHKSSK